MADNSGYSDKSNLEQTKLIKEIMNYDKLNSEDQQNSQNKLIIDDLNSKKFENEIPPGYEDSFSYRRLYWTIYSKNIVLMSNYKELSLDNHLISSEISRIKILLKKIKNFNYKVKF